MALIRGCSVCVVGIGGVGSWAAEALARTGIGKLTLIDFDTISVSNINRQVHALDQTVDKKKFEVMKARCLQIHPTLDCVTVDDYLRMENLQEWLGPEQAYDYVIDAIDSISVKAAMIHQCKRNKIPIITTGGAGGLTDPTTISVKDLSRTWNDPLAAKVRSRLREQHGFSRNPKRYFGVECVFSTQQPVYPTAEGGVSQRKPGIHGVHLDCRLGYGSASFVTASFGMIAAARVINRLIHRKLST